MKMIYTSKKMGQIPNRINSEVSAPDTSQSNCQRQRDDFENSSREVICHMQGFSHQTSSWLPISILGRQKAVCDIFITLQERGCQLEILYLLKTALQK